jgi:uracil-DNA glycosylase
MDGLDELREKWPLSFWYSKEYEDVCRKLDRMELDTILFNPSRDNIFRSLRLTLLRDCVVCIVGQDPYPDPRYATGVAFSSSTPERWLANGGQEDTSIPSSLRCLYREYTRDLGYAFPTHGCLESWCEQGVLLWNATPTVEIDRVASGKWKVYTHEYWREWQVLTREIVAKLSNKGGVVFVFFGARARHYSKWVNTAKYVNTDDVANTVLMYSHPSPRAQISTNSPIVGSRLFSTINYHVVKHGNKAIDWKIE